MGKMVKLRCFITLKIIAEAIWKKKTQTDYTLKIGIFHHRVIVKVGENIHAVKGTSSHDPAAAARGG